MNNDKNISDTIRDLVTLELQETMISEINRRESETNESNEYLINAFRVVLTHYMGYDRFKSFESNINQ
jgi:hypothetical protein